MVKKQRKVKDTANKKNIYIIISFLAFICIIFSLVIYLQKVSDDPAVHQICSAISPSSQCTVVQQSDYGKTLGIDNPVFGLIGFTALMILAWMYYRTGDKIARILTFIGVSIAGATALWFLYLQAFVLKAYCIFCVFIDVISVAMMIMVIFLLIKKK